MVLGLILAAGVGAAAGTLLAGAGNQSAVVQTMRNTNVVDLITRAIQRTVNETNVTINNSNVSNVSAVGATITNCAIDVAQAIDADVKTYSLIDAQQQAKIQQDVIAELTAELKRTLDQTIKNIPFGTNTEDLASEIVNENVVNAVAEVVNETVNKFNQRLSSLNESTINLDYSTIMCDPPGTIVDVDQRIDLEAFIENAVTVANRAETEQSSIADLDAEAEIITDQLNEGVDPLMFLLLLLLIPLIIFIAFMILIVGLGMSVKSAAWCILTFGQGKGCKATKRG